MNVNRYISHTYIYIYIYTSIDMYCIRTNTCHTCRRRKKQEAGCNLLHNLTTMVSVVLPARLNMQVGAMREQLQEAVKP